MFYMIVSFAAVYVLSLMAIYCLSAVLNLIHLKKKKKRRLYRGTGVRIAGEKVTPLLAARVDRGIALLQRNPKAVLIMSGGQGPGEKIPESEAMADYAIEQGVDADRIIKEQRSVSTQENLQFSGN